jgi:hypothetical protein
MARRVGGGGNLQWNAATTCNGTLMLVSAPVFPAVSARPRFLSGVGFFARVHSDAENASFLQIVIFRALMRNSSIER